MSHSLPLRSLDPDELGELRGTVRDAATESGYPAAVGERE